MSTNSIPSPRARRAPLRSPNRSSALAAAVRSPLLLFLYVTRSVSNADFSLLLSILSHPRDWNSVPVR